LRRGERGQSALRGLELCRTMVGGDKVLPWKEWGVLGYPGSGDGERWGEGGRWAEEGVQARGEGGMLLVDLRRPTL